MHQLPRPSSKAAAPVATSSALAADERATADARDQDRAAPPRSGSEPGGRATAAATGSSQPLTGHSREAVTKLNQIIQV